MEFTDRIYLYDNKYTKGQLTVNIGEILQVAESSVASAKCVLEHTQICDEITYIISGSGYFTVDGICEYVKSGQIHYVKKGCIHSIRADNKENLRYICIGYLPNPENDINVKFLSAVDEKKYFVISDDGNVKILSELLIREFHAWDELSKDTVNRYLSQITVAMYRILCGNRGSLQGQLYGGKKSDAVIYSVLRYIDSEYIALKTVKEIAEKTAYNENYISHLFKEKMNISVKEYLMRKKTEYAAQLLKTSRIEIEELALVLNFSSSHSFRRTFKQYMGCSPSEYKKANYVP